MNVDAGPGQGDLEPAGSTSKTPGELLREERTRRKLSVQQAAEDLHLDVRLVEAIEANNFQALGAPVYAKGHLRKYATLLGLSQDVVIARYHALQDVPEIPTPVPTAAAIPQPRERISIKVPLPVWIVAGAVLLGGLGVWALNRWYPRGPTTQAPAEQPREEQKVEQAVQAPPPTAATPAQPPPNAASAAMRMTMRLEFQSPSWTEVYDAEGRRLFYDIGQPQQSRTVSGVAPLRVVLGMASGITLRVDGKKVVIPRQWGKDATRFEVAADGTVR